MLQFIDDEGKAHELITATAAAEYLKVTNSCIHYYGGQKLLRFVALTGMRLVYLEDIHTIEQTRTQRARDKAVKEPKEPAAA